MAETDIRLVADLKEFWEILDSVKERIGKRAFSETKGRE
jgi:hypothetical protein